MTYLVLIMAVFCTYILGRTGIERIRAGRLIFGVGCMISASIFLIMAGAISAYVAASLMMKLTSVVIAIGIGAMVIAAVKRKFPETT